MDRLPELVVKEVAGSGGYGMLIGTERKQGRSGGVPRGIRANPANYLRSPRMSLSTCPTFVDRDIAPRHVDLRPFVLQARK